MSSERTLSHRAPNPSAPWLVLVLGALTAANAALGAVRSSTVAGGVVFAAVVLAGAAAVALSLHRGARWARWVSLTGALVGLFFVLPVAGTVLLGGPLEPVGTGWDLVFFPLTAAILVALLIALRGRRGAAS